MKMIYWSIEYLASFIEVGMCFYFCAIFLLKENLEEKKNQILWSSVIGALILIGLNNIKLFSYLSSVLFLVICELFLWWVYRKPLQSMALMLIYSVILSAIDFLTVYILSMFGDSNGQRFLEEQNAERILGIFLSKTLLVVLILTVRKIYSNKKVISSRYIVIMSLSSIFLLLSNFLTVGNMTSAHKLSSMIVFVVILIVELVLFYFVLNMAEYYEQRQTMALIEMKNEMLQKSLDDTQQAFSLWRKSVHDYKNNIISLLQMLEEQNLEEMKEYLQKESELVSREMFYIKTGNTMVDAMINTKQYAAKQKGITFVVNAIIPENCKIKGIDMAGILGNLIDNALEASEQEKEPYVDIAISLKKNFLVICVKNKFSKKLEENMKTTKKDKMFHGIGLKSVRNTVKKYNGEILIDSDKEEFTVNILLLNK